MAHEFDEFLAMLREKRQRREAFIREHGEAHYNEMACERDRVIELREWRLMTERQRQAAVRERNHAERLGVA